MQPFTIFFWGGGWEGGGSSLAVHIKSYSNMLVIVSHLAGLGLPKPSYCQTSNPVYPCVCLYKYIQT